MGDQVDQMDIQEPQKGVTPILYELDPAGDVTFVVVNIPQDLPENLRDLKADFLAGQSTPEATPTGSDRDGQLPPETSTPASSKKADKIRLRIRASSKHLVLASGYFARMFAGGFSEGLVLQSQGSVELQILHVNGLAFLLLMLIIHGRPRLVPRKVSKETLTDVAILVDYYQCQDPVEVFSDMWIKDLEDVEETTSLASLQWVMISWVFKYNPKFKKASKAVVSDSPDTISSLGLPLPANILAKMNDQRISFLQNFIDGLHRQLEVITKGCLKRGDRNTKNVELCLCAVLGAFTHDMFALNVLSPKPESPFSNIQISKLVAAFKETPDSPRVEDEHSTTHNDCRLSARRKALFQQHPLPEGLDLDDLNA
ncbi:hypothetical protein ASPCAL13969 [Aspergillus calidoustus]|uniref:BTB domain-containing protein n=1 Tax=Aspergillus calidoustus TaxID=454130 RepID=A0A0U5GI07_ASPCI|nr:hypothetical protein ASPCAL13969 [Aspergillus calidoustus]